MCDAIDSVHDGLKKLSTIAPEWLRIWKPAQMSTPYVKMHKGLDLVQYQLRQKIESYCQRRYGNTSEERRSLSNPSREPSSPSRDSRQPSPHNQSAF